MNIRPGRILFIHEGESYQRAQFATGRAYWSAGLTVVLEKHGLVGVDVSAPATLANGETLRQYDAILVARLADSAWTADVIETLRNTSAQIFLEGPLPQVVLRGLLAVACRGADKAVKGNLVVRDESLQTLSASYTIPGSSVQGDMLTKFDRRPFDLQWQLTNCPIDQRTATIWGQVPFTFAPWLIKDAKLPSLELATLIEENKQEWPCIVQRHHIIACSFEIFSFLVYQHTAEPFSVNTYRSVDYRSGGIEACLLALIDRMLITRKKTRIRLLPWQRGRKWAVSTRHDFDREIPVERTREVLALHAQHSMRATWYWRACHAKSPSLGVVAADSAMEIGLHTERVWVNGEQELASFEGTTRPDMIGASAHGGHDSFRFQGAPNLLWIERAGLRYSDMVCRKNLHPHFFVALEHDGVIRRANLICLPRHVSLDTGPREGLNQPEIVLQSSITYRNAGGLLQIMNHPDINLDALRQVLEQIELDDAALMTAGEVARWWSSTHCHDELKLTVLDNRFSIRLLRSAAVDPEALAFELLHPSGAREVISGRRIEDAFGLVEASAQPKALPFASEKDGGGRPSEQEQVDQTARPKDTAKWVDIVSGFGRLIRNYYLLQKQDPDSKSCKATTRTNTELVPARAKMLDRFFRRATGSEVFFTQGKDVLEAGCGFGSLGMYMATEGRARSVAALDMREDFIRNANTLAESFGLTHIRYVSGDMQNLAFLPDDSVDVIVCNNSLYYIPSRTGVRHALNEFRRVLRPGGQLIVYQANRWRLRDAFTQAPIVHLLPAWLASFVCRYTSWSHSHDRVEFISPIDLRIRIWRADFIHVRQLSADREKILTGFRALFGKFYCTIAEVGRRL